MEDKKNKNIYPISQNTTETEIFKPSDIHSTNFEDFNFPQGKDINILLEYYNKKKGNGDFMDKISKLNKKFYNCSENYIKSKKKLEKLNDDLYMNLFKQINCYVEEIERLNKKIAANNNQELKKTIDNLNREISDKKEKIRNYEIKLKEKNENEEKLMKEIESYKRRIIFYKDKIKIGLLSRERNIDLNCKDNMIDNKKNIAKNNYIFTTSDIKIKKYFDKNNISNKKDLSSKLLEKVNNKEDIRNQNEEKKPNKTDKKFYKLKESIFKIDDNNYQKRGKNFSDIYDKDNDITEKRNEEEIKLNIDGYSQNFSSKYSNKPSYEIIKGKEIDEKNRTFDENNKGRNIYDNQLKKNSENLNILDNKYQKNIIKSKIINSQKKQIKRNDGIKIEIDNKNINKFKKIDKSMNQKPGNKNNYIISKFSDIDTPNINKKYANKYIIEKVRPISIKIKENKKIHNNDKLTTNQNINQNKRFKDIKINDYNQSYLNRTNQQLTRNKNIYREINKENNKDIELILKAVNEDYINNIEMLKTQEEQIKAMLKLMDLTEK